VPVLIEWVAGSGGCERRPRSQRWQPEQTVPAEGLSNGQKAPDDMQAGLLDTARKRMESNTLLANSLEEVIARVQKPPPKKAAANL